MQCGQLQLSSKGQLSLAVAQTAAAKLAKHDTGHQVISVSLAAYLDVMLQAFCDNVSKISHQKLVVEVSIGIDTSSMLSRSPLSAQRLSHRGHVLSSFRNNTSHGRRHSGSCSLAFRHGGQFA